MHRHSSLILFFLVAITLLSCATPPPPPDPELEKHPPFTVIDQGTQSGLTLAKHLVITSAEDWQELWHVHSNKPVPKIDFTKEMVIAVFLGEYPTGGYQVEVHSLEKTTTALQVVLTIHSPAADAARSMALSQPFVMIKTARISLPVQFSLYQKQVIN